MRRSILLAWLFPVLLTLAGTARGEDVSDLLRQARAEFAKGGADAALALAARAATADPKDPRPPFFRGTVYEATNKHPEAVAEFTKAVALDPMLAEAYDHRGSEQFKLGKVRESVADFDKFLELKPEAEPGHWKRGISYYYAGRYDEGKKQFEGYEKVDANDVENAVWRYLCMARASGVEKARAALLKVGDDRRVPMMRVYELFAGRAKPEDVLAAAREGKPAAAALNERLFYAHLYLGLYHEAAGDRKQALAHLRAAAEDHKIGHYMWDVARVHLDRLRKEAPPR